jgi:heterodisulfide reductase subunit C
MSESTSTTEMDEREVEFISFMLQRSISEMATEVCDQCGVCPSVCPVSRHMEGFNPRLLIAKVSYGRIDELLGSEDIWTCTSCLKCKERCPEEISPYDVIMILRNLAYRAGYHYPEAYDDFIKGVRETGYITVPKPVRSRGGEKISREDLGLPQVSGPFDMTVFRSIIDGIVKAGIKK